MMLAVESQEASRKWQRLEMKRDELDIFHPERLSSEEDLQCAMGAVAKMLNKCRDVSALIAEAISGPQFLLEVLLSGRYRCHSRLITI
jgi:hypothetical protein